MKTYLHFFRANKMKMLVLGILAFSLMSFHSFLLPNPDPGLTGSPCDGGNNCTNCHTDYALNSGTATYTITSNIPLCGYTPGNTYTITASVNQPGFSLYQFELSPQKDPSCVAFGVLTAGPTTSIQTGGGFQYISAITANNTNTWSFTWTAPATGQGPGTFYSAFNAANGDVDPGGDYIYTTSYTVQECISTPLAATVLATNLICNNLCNGTATVTASGGTVPYTYLWNNSQTTSTATGLCAGSYTAVVTDAASATVSATVTITQPTALTSTVTVVGPICGNSNGSASVAISGGTPPYTYSWSNGNTTSAVTGITVTSVDTLILTTSDANGCIKIDTAIIPCTFAVNTIESDNQISAYPNPTSGICRLSPTLSKEEGVVEVYSVLGERILSLPFGKGGDGLLDLSSQPEGIYFVNLKTADGNIVRKIVVQR